MASVLCSIITAALPAQQSSFIKEPTSPDSRPVCVCVCTCTCARVCMCLSVHAFVCPTSPDSDLEQIYLYIMRQKEISSEREQERQRERLDISISLSGLKTLSMDMILCVLLFWSAAVHTDWYDSKREFCFMSKTRCLFQNTLLN